MSDAITLPSNDGPDPYVSVYDKGIVDRSMRSFYGEDGYCNVGYWSEGCTSLGDASRQLVNRLISQIGKDARTVLDVGCGLGATTKQIRAARPASEVTGINISAFQVERCRSFAPECNFQCMDAAEITFPAASYDAVVSVEAAFHFNTREKFLRHSFRVLTPRGRLVLTDILTQPGPLASQIAVWPVAQENHFPDLASYSDLLATIGFTDIYVQDVTENTWLPWCRNIERSLPGDFAEGLISRETFDSFMSAIPQLAAAVRSYVQVSAAKP